MRNLLLITLGAALLITSCGKNEKFNIAAESSAPAIAASSDIAVSDSVGSGMVVRTATLRLQYDSLATGRKNLSLMLQKYGAYISHENDVRYSGTHEIKMEIRVPQRSLTAFADEVCSGAKFIDQKELNSDDVGLEFTDLQARMKAKQELEKRYLQLLQKAGKISDMLEVEEKMNIVRADIESMQGRINYLSNKAAMATLTVSMYELLPASTSPTRGFFARAGENFKHSFQVLIEVILFMISLWPLLLIPGIAIPVIMISRRKIKTV